MEMRFDGSIFAPFHTLIACIIGRVILSQDSSTISGKIIVLKSMFLRHTQHFCEGSSESSSRWAIIRAEIEPQPRPCWNHFTGSRQLAREGRQHGTWDGGAVANPQLIVATFRVEVEKLHFDNEAPCHTDAPNTVLSVGVIVRVVRACKLPNVLSTDGQWTSWKRRPRSQNHLIPLGSLHPFLTQVRRRHSSSVAAILEDVELSLVSEVFSVPPKPASIQ